MDWPEANGDEQELERYKAQLTELQDRASRLDAADERFQAAYYGVLASRVDQTKAAAETVQRAAAAIGTLYAAGVGVSFSVADNPLPARGVVPLIFLGASVVMSTVYLAWGGGGRAAPSRKPGETEDPFERAKRYVWDFAAVAGEYLYRRQEYLRASIVALAFGLVLLPAPFITVDVGAHTSPGPDGAGAPTAEPAVPAWPSAEGVTTDAEVSLFEAQVAEAATLRAEAREDLAGATDGGTFAAEWLPDDGTGWVALTLVLSVALAAYLFLQRPRRDQTSAPSKRARRRESRPGTDGQPQR